MGNELKTIGGAIGVVGTSVAAGVTFGQVDALNQAVKDTSKFTAKNATNTGIAKVVKVAVDPLNGEKWADVGYALAETTAGPVLGVATEIAKPIQCAVKGERYSGFDPSALLNSGDALKSRIDSERNKRRGIWVGKRGLKCRAVQTRLTGHLNLFHACIILDGKGYSFDPNSNSGGQDLLTFRHDDREAGSYEWVKITGYSVNRSRRDLDAKAQSLATNYQLLCNNCQTFVQTMAEYAARSSLVDTQMAF